MTSVGARKRRQVRRPSVNVVNNLNTDSVAHMDFQEATQCKLLPSIMSKKNVHTSFATNQSSSTRDQECFKSRISEVNLIQVAQTKKPSVLDQDQEPTLILSGDMLQHITQVPINIVNHPLLHLNILHNPAVFYVRTFDFCLSFLLHQNV